MVQFLPMLAMRGPIDGEEAVGIARRFLAQMGAPKDVGLNTVVQQRAQDWQRPSGLIWFIGLDMPRGGGYSVNLDERGRVFYVSRTGKDAGSTNREFGRRLMARVPNAAPVRQDAGDPGRFHLILDGRRYFNLNPTYGYYMRFDEKGILTWFGREDTPPPPVTRIPKINRAAAIAKLTPIMKRTPPMDWPYPRFVEAELGYYVRKGEPKARLVWRGTTTFVSHGSKSELSTLDSLVDASTGAIFKADDR